jgi:hypothetical protein
MITNAGKKYDNTGTVVKINMVTFCPAQMQVQAICDVHLYPNSAE